ncbi:MULTISPECIES: Bax inhibitor-1/YccA family protein [Ligilactobacillus]|uniref:Bax inhibitor-1/YccA family protein n=1 Tax=Ligilactobacillus animalis TaxID=1605 RepID=A0AAJ6FLH6_9LACO|nr:Bax inhibitor-1/YccA family protein [Ligilactobacillus animalis]KDA45843.1 cytochrome c oxidase, subunit II, coxB [Ligilactobacillus animalis]MDO5882732.1 Bax inhibitor-1/YccA family protein [Ligilactobacillus animalis]MDQ2233539.1 Bax inhibitor-1/YccA family protein [Ligilactobacillus animalis]MDU1488327.1 Bax inhibitor-1/YccA family protein [Ligilactobacillus animalis]MDU3188060.1 Bax inhibitor-1/YccA family protein [Ligilactobacillus animalis]
MNNNPEVYGNSNAGLNSFFTKMYGYMSAAVAVSALTAFLGSFSPTVIRFMSNPIALFAVFGVQLVLAYSMSSLKSQRSPLVSALGLFVFAGLEGLLFSGIFIVYTAQNITSAFVSAFVMFAVLSFMGSTTKKDLSGIGRQARAALIAFIIVSLINMFLQSPMITYVFSFIGLVIFAGLTAWDTQRLRQMYLQMGSQVNVNNLALMGALQLYLDFINIFIFLLNIFTGAGGDRD